MILDSELARVRAALVNSGRFSFAEAEARISASEASIFIDDELSGTPAGQAALLTATVTAARCFGRVSVSGALDRELVVPFPLGADSLGAAAVQLGGVREEEGASARHIAIGGRGCSTSSWEIHPYWDGWVVGAGPQAVRPGRGDVALAGVAAGALCVAQAFLAEQGDLRAGRISNLASLWAPHLPAVDADNPRLAQISLPGALWLIGLGNLGQSYLWSLFMLPYAEPERVMLYLQDRDYVDRENWGTSVLVQRGRYGDLKSKIAEEWSDLRGFRVRRVDRWLDEDCRRHIDEPSIALSGLDRMPPRRLLGRVGFEHVVDCGLGATVNDYQKFRINVFDRGHDPARHFEGVEDLGSEAAAAILQLPAYQELARQSADGGCGAAMLAGKAVAAPFVSAFVGAMAVTQVIRIVSGEAPCLSATGVLGDLKTVRASLGSGSPHGAVEALDAKEYT